MPRQFRLPPWYLGCDPGAAGGLAVIEDGADPVVSKIPDDRQLLSWFRLLRPSLVRRVVCVLERVGGYVESYSGDVSKGGGQRQPGHTMFKFGVGYGKLMMAALSADIVPLEVSPVTWQREFLPPGGTYGRDRKRALKEVASRLFPQVRVTLAVADALLLAEFARRLDAGHLTATDTPTVRALRSEVRRGG